ncbi:MAG TPA: peptidoglycan editing factor PgeF [Syntrophomonadaceae bacterium]|nr:peptidoglycan editing factor PgeF [Syntrophomonadaceae bacterium]
MEFVLKQQQEELPYLYLPLFGDGGARALFTTRLGGVSRGCYSSLNLGYHTGDQPDAVTANRRLTAQALDIKDDRFFTVNQVHGDRVLVIESETDVFSKKGSRADAMVTHLQDVALTIFCADCQAVYIYDPLQRVIAIAHSGWRGTVARVAANCLQVMSHLYGSRPRDCRTALSPAAGCCCYEVGENVCAAVKEAFPGLWQRLLAKKDTDRWHFKISQANSLVLQDAGVRKENICISKLCTICRQDIFFSHRGSKGTTGRMAAVLIQ